MASKRLWWCPYLVLFFACPIHFFSAHSTGHVPAADGEHLLPEVCTRTLYCLFALARMEERLHQQGMMMEGKNKPEGLSWPLLCLRGSTPALHCFFALWAFMFVWPMTGYHVHQHGQ